MLVSGCGRQSGHVHKQGRRVPPHTHHHHHHHHHHHPLTPPPPHTHTHTLCSRDGKYLTLKEGFESLNLTPYHLNVRRRAWGVVWCGGGLCAPVGLWLVCS